MHDLAEVPTQTPIAIALGVDENGMTTAKKLYEFLELSPSNYSKWCKTNIIDNEFAEENIDYWAFVPNDERNFNPNPTTDYRLSAHFAKKLSMKGNGVKAEQAREYFTTVEERVKQRTIDYAQLSPELQMFQKIFNSVAQQQMEQRRQAYQLNKIEEKQDALVETFQNFCREHYFASRYQDAWNESYARLSEKRACRLSQRVKTAREKAEKNGASQSAIKDITYLSVISNDKDLKPVYETVIREMMIAYCVTDN